MKHPTWVAVSVVFNIVVLVLFAAMQVVRPPVRNGKINPSQTIEAQMHPPQEVENIFNRACNDCHSEKTDWRWYGSIAPAVWLQAADVSAGRAHMDLSRWSRYTPAQQADRLNGMCKLVKNGEMPLWYFVPLHPSARMSQADAKTLCDWSEPESRRIQPQTGTKEP